MSIETAVIYVIYTLRAAAGAQSVTTQSSHIECCTIAISLKVIHGLWFTRINVHLSLLPSVLSLEPLGLSDYFRGLHVSRIYANH